MRWKISGLEAATGLGQIGGSERSCAFWAKLLHVGSRDLPTARRLQEDT